jgi:hypothetical protein
MIIHENKAYLNIYSIYRNPATHYAFHKIFNVSLWRNSMAAATGTTGRDPFASVSRFTDIVSDYSKTGTGIKNLALKPLITIFDWIQLSGRQLTGPEQNLYNTSREVKNFLSGMGTIAAVNDLKEAGLKLHKAVVKGEGFSTVADATANVFAKAGDVVMSAWDGCSFLLSRHLIDLTAEQVKAGGLASSIGGIAYSGYGTVTEGISIAKEVEAIADSGLATAATDDDKAAAMQVVETSMHRIGLKLLEQARNISYLVLGILGVVGFALGMVFSPWITTTLATVALVGILGAYFYKKTVNPYQEA